MRGWTSGAEAGEAEEEWAGAATEEENRGARATRAKHRADLRQWIRRHSARLPRKADARRTRKEPRTNSPVKRRASQEEKAAKHPAADDDQAERIKAAADQ